MHLLDLTALQQQVTFRICVSKPFKCKASNYDALHKESENLITMTSEDVCGNFNCPEKQRSLHTRIFSTAYTFCKIVYFIDMVLCHKNASKD